MGKRTGAGEQDRPGRGRFFSQGGAPATAAAARCRQALAALMVLAAGIFSAVPAGPGALGALTVEAQAGELQAMAAEPYMKITVIDYGAGRSVYGDATLLESGGQYLLIDTGAKDPGNTVVGYLKKKGIRNLSLYISHFHEDHCDYAVSILNDSFFHVKKVYLANPEPARRYATAYYKSHNKKLYTACRECSERYKAIVSAARKKKAAVRDLRRGDAFSVGSVRAKVLWDHNPRGASMFDPYDRQGIGYLNNSSLVTKFTLGRRSFLTAGDIECSTERDLLAAGVDLSADIFKLNHHGIWSANTLAFVRAVNPCYVYYSYKDAADREYRKIASAPDVAPTLKKLAGSYNILGSRYNGTITYKVQYNTITVSAQRHVKKKTIRVRSNATKKVRTQTLVYNDAQSLILDRRMLLSGTTLLTGTAIDRTPAPTGWVKDATGWKYRTAKGVWLSGGWKTVGGKTYYFTVRGYRHEGWLTKDGKTYFMSRIGIRQTGWQMIDGKVYYFSTKDGHMLSGKSWISGKSWPLRADGSLDLSKRNAPGTGILTVERRHTTKK